MLGAAHADTLASMAALAALIADLGRSAEAEPLMRQVLIGRRHTLGSQHPDTLQSARAVADLLERNGRLAETLARG